MTYLKRKLVSLAKIKNLFKNSFLQEGKTNSANKYRWKLKKCFHQPENQFLQTAMKISLSKSFQ